MKDTNIAFIIAALLFALTMGALSSSSDTLDNYKTGRNFSNKTMSESSYIKHLENNSK